ncbi:phosphoribosyltransferase family protein [Cryobacterium psychrophilum]|uniref:Phosphoribosyltransferase n=1 Tax=Cryobacterium psychrophilum TaxID=41988 RepID=A0A4Y8KT95_9MICO|nr:phosphoribosyltransferase family protein [Cryobacterium psychrophilum]TDW28803.1 putative phosphoribosyl transferase [Cryobacterium psychrophilum]TFD82446.1 phosphoribosyltransferase [Cryobacterium psychrophilum]
MVVFADRIDAGRQLAEQLEFLRGQDVVVLGLPRGGVPVAAEVAAALGAPLDVILVRKLGVPIQPELAMGAIGEGGVRVLNDEVLSMARVTEEEFRAVEERERAQLDARMALFRKGHERIDLTGRIAVIVDDGIATGSTARVACEVARRLGAAKVILGVTVAPAETIRNLPGADEVVCVHLPRQLIAVGNHYVDFSPTSDEEVIRLLAAAGRPSAGAAGTTDPAESSGAETDAEIEIPVGEVYLGAHLRIPPAATGLVLFAHGSGSSRHSPRNRFVAEVLHEAGLATLLLDLLTPEEEPSRANVFDIKLLADRLAGATEWVGNQPETASLAVGYFGASTGAGAALWAAAHSSARIGAVVSRGGRPDLAGPWLAQVQAPTLLIVGGADQEVLDLNRRAQVELRCPNHLAVVPGATHLFEEPGTLAEAAALARDWFTDHLSPRADGRPARDKQ